MTTKYRLFEKIKYIYTQTHTYIEFSLFFFVIEYIINYNFIIAGHIFDFFIIFPFHFSSKHTHCQFDILHFSNTLIWYIFLTIIILIKKKQKQTKMNESPSTSSNKCCSAMIQLFRTIFIKGLFVCFLNFYFEVFCFWFTYLCLLWSSYP